METRSGEDLGLTVAGAIADDEKAKGITVLVGSYETIYGGNPNRINNVQFVAHLIDGKLVAPGATFSFNGRPVSGPDRGSWKRR